MREQFGIGPQTAATLLAVAGDKLDAVYKEASTSGNPLVTVTVTELS